ncbi:Fic family protein [Streptomyces sp. BSE7-9]|uniref:Fic family protein n=1 Tax=Streptomyces sp. BSE7-9 TaxID=2759948 RepID=UPI0018EE893B|nr:Fic family protein [Streptomyces sp. BSE7-9]MBJ6642682.1 Fic family protein [Streptomyces sp. BSE7-9]
MHDDLRSWLRVRSQIAWHEASDELVGPVRGTRDAIDAVAGARDGRRDTARGGRMRAAWRLAQTDAAADRPLGLGLLVGWQKLILGRPDVAFRNLPAFAKGGRERYGVCEETPEQFEECLSQATEPATDVPLPARAARAYLDVCFFHPFDDGNGRAALLTMGFVLAREKVFLDEVGPVQVRRYADDPVGALSLARLIHILASAAARRGGVRTHSDPGEAESPDHIDGGVRSPLPVQGGNRA